MPDVVSNDELNALAAEYVLGTLDYEERKGASALLEVDATFRGIVRIWERRFGDLHLMVEAVTPDPQLWQRIRPKIPGIEQIPTAIPSHADEPAAAVAAAATAVPAAEVVAPSAAPAADATSAKPEAEAPKTDAAVAEATASPAATDAAPTTESEPAEPRPAEPTPAEPTPAEATPFEAAVAKAQAAEAAPAEAKPADSKPADSKPADSKAADSTPPAVVEAELKLAELAALLPVPGQDGVERAAPAAHVEPGPAQPGPEEGLHTHAPDTVPRGFVPPVPMSTRGTPTVVEVPVRKGGGGWVAATLAMALIAVVLAGLISAWRFFPERLPAQLRANTLLNLNMTTTAAQPAPKARPKLAPFDE